MLELNFETFLMPVLIILGPCINLLQYRIRKQKLGKIVALHEISLDDNKLDFIAFALFAYSIYLIYLKNPKAITTIMFAIGIFLMRFKQKKFASSCGLYTNGIILEKGIYPWKKIHSIESISEYKVEILLSNGIAVEYNPKYQKEQLINLFSSNAVSKQKNI